MTRGSAVAAGDTATVAAATAVLAAGGTAVDAAVAAGFAGAVAEPGLTSLGGGGFLLVRPLDGPAVLLDFFVDVPGRGRPPDHPGRARPETIHYPAADQTFGVGAGSVAVPGCLAGYLHAHARWGRLPLAEVLAPAADAARAGVRLAPGSAEVLGLVSGLLTYAPDGAQLYEPLGRPARAGDVHTNPAYADFLDALADGQFRGGFADPALSAPLVSRMDAEDGWLTAADLAAYQVVERSPVRFELGDHTVLTNCPPSFGGELVRLGLRALADGADLPTALAMISDRATIDGLRAVHGTTHVSVADGDGTVVAMTTSTGTCSGVLVPGTGIQLNNMMGESDLVPDARAWRPGTRVGSMMAPTVLAGPRRVVAVGTGGSERIRSALTQVVARLVAGETLEQAVLAPRLHWDGSRFQAEPGLPEEVLAAVGDAPLRVWPARNLYFGGTHAVAVDAPGVGDGAGVEAVGDPRRSGHGVVLGAQAH